EPARPGHSSAAYWQVTCGVANAYSAPISIPPALVASNWTFRLSIEVVPDWTGINLDRLRLPAGGIRAGTTADRHLTGLCCFPVAIPFCAATHCRALPVGVEVIPYWSSLNPIRFYRC